MKEKLKEKISYFIIGEWVLWTVSVVIIISTFFVFRNTNYISLIGSILGVTSLVFCAKGNPIGQALIIVFSILYAINSYRFAYYGEMITYFGMTTPMAIASLIVWLKNPFKGDKKQVKINVIKGKEYFLAFGLTAVETIVFYFVLKVLNTANLIISTVLVATSFIAIYFTFRRSPLYALGYAANDVVLIIMWILATIEDKSYLSMVICICVFLFNDVYSFLNWHRMRKKQSSVETELTEKFEKEVNQNE